MARRSSDGISSSDIQDLTMLIGMGAVAYYVIQNPTVLDQITSALNGLFGGGGGGALVGEVGPDGYTWFKARGETTTIKQTRKNSGDYRWSGNVSGLSSGMEALFVGTFNNVAGDGHFAMKHGGPNHSGGKECCWWDTGIRSNGEVQLQTEKPHPNNHTFKAPLKIDNIGKGMEGNTIGLKWLDFKEGDKWHLMMWVDTDPLAGGKPANNWQLVYDFIDTHSNLASGYDPPDEWDCEIRVSDTKTVDDHGGLHVRKL